MCCDCLVVRFGALPGLNLLFLAGNISLVVRENKDFEERRPILLTEIVLVSGLYLCRFVAEIQASQAIAISIRDASKNIVRVS